jgi:hypothetical protein
MIGLQEASRTARLFLCRERWQGQPGLNSSELPAERVRQAS